MFGLYKVILTFELVIVEEIVERNHSNESYYAVLSCGAVYYAVLGDSNFWVCGRNPRIWQIKLKAIQAPHFPMALYMFILLYKPILTGWNPKVLFSRILFIILYKVVHFRGCE